MRCCLPSLSLSSTVTAGSARPKDFISSLDGRDGPLDLCTCRCHSGEIDGGFTDGRVDGFFEDPLAVLRFEGEVSLRPLEETVVMSSRLNVNAGLVAIGRFVSRLRVFEFEKVDCRTPPIAATRSSRIVLRFIYSSYLSFAGLTVFDERAAD